MRHYTITAFLSFMKPFLFITSLVYFCLTGCTSTQKIRLQVNYKQPYCGGARPTPEILQDAELPKPYSAKTVFILSENGKAFPVTTSPQGLIETKVKPGTYYLAEAWRYKKTTPDGTPLSDYETTCLQEEWKKSIGSFTVNQLKSGNDSNSVKMFLLELPCPWQLPCLKEGKRHLPE